MVHLDDAGLAHPRQEPHVVIGGTIFHADRQWKSVERAVNALADDVVPPDRRKGFVFHAHELFHGGKTFPRDEFDKETRWRILERLLEIVADLELVVVWGACQRVISIKQYPNDPGAALNHSRGVAFYACAHWIEMYMRHSCADEVVTIFMEDNDHARKTHRTQHHFARNPDNERILQDAGFGNFAMTHIVDDISFCQKTDSSPLQLADACAFTIKRFIMAKKDCERFYEVIRPQMLTWPKQLPTAP
jgi:hypothetical protein